MAETVQYNPTQLLASQVPLERTGWVDTVAQISFGGPWRGWGDQSVSATADEQPLYDHDEVLARPNRIELIGRAVLAAAGFVGRKTASTRLSPQDLDGIAFPQPGSFHTTRPPRQALSIADIDQVMGWVNASPGAHNTWRLGLWERRHRAAAEIAQAQAIFRATAQNQRDMWAGTIATRTAQQDSGGSVNVAAAYANRTRDIVINHARFGAAITGAILPDRASRGIALFASAAQEYGSRLHVHLVEQTASLRDTLRWHADVISTEWSYNQAGSIRAKPSANTQAQGNYLSTDRDSSTSGTDGTARQSLYAEALVWVTEQNASFAPDTHATALINRWLHTVRAVARTRAEQLQIVRPLANTIATVARVSRPAVRAGTIALRRLRLTARAGAEIGLEAASTAANLLGRRQLRRITHGQDFGARIEAWIEAHYAQQAWLDAHRTVGGCIPIEVLPIGVPNVDAWVQAHRAQREDRPEEDRGPGVFRAVWAAVTSRLANSGFGRYMLDASRGLRTTQVALPRGSFTALGKRQNVPQFTSTDLPEAATDAPPPAEESLPTRSWHRTAGRDLATEIAWVTTTLNGNVFDYAVSSPPWLEVNSGPNHWSDVTDIISQTTRYGQCIDGLVTSFFSNRRTELRASQDQHELAAIILEHIAQQPHKYGDYKKIARYIERNYRISIEEWVSEALAAAQICGGEEIDAQNILLLAGNTLPSLRRALKTHLTMLAEQVQPQSARSVLARVTNGRFGYSRPYGHIPKQFETITWAYHTDDY